MSLYDVLLKHSPNKVFLSLVLGVLTGIAFSFLIPLVMMALEEQQQFALFGEEVGKVGFLFFDVSSYKLAVAFLITCVLIMIFKTISQVIISRVAMAAASNLRIEIYDKINQVPIAQLEKIGTPKLMSSITNDVPRIVSGSMALPDLIICSMSVVGVLLFLAFLNINAFLFIFVGLLIGIFTYQIPVEFGAKHFTEGRVFWDKLHEGIRGVIYGAKELKLNRVKRDAFIKDELLPNEWMIRIKERQGYVLMQGANNYGDMIGFIVIGAVTFILTNYQSMAAGQLFGVVMAMIYILSPISAILQCIPLISVGKVSLNELNSLMSSMESEVQSDLTGPKPEWKQMTLRDVCYSYDEKEENLDGFHIGPISFSIKKGEVTFIVGGNGSGKSTLAKIISQHYLPTHGSVCFDGVEVTEKNRDLYRREISAIYSDYHLFNKIHGVEHPEADATVSRYLVELGLNDKVTISDGRFSTTALSDGQKRRLALVVAYLDNSEIYLFDEWAADQDPSFKEIFYREVLPNLKRAGKAVVVISHDDRYFDLADQLVELEAGKIRRVVNQSQTTPVERSERMETVLV